MGAGRFDIYVEQGATLKIPIVIKVGESTFFNLANWMPRGQIRRTHRTNEITAEFDFDVTDPENGEMTIILSADTTKDIPAGETDLDERGKYVYDIELEHGPTGPQSGDVKRLLKGFVYVSPEVTKPTGP